MKQSLITNYFGNPRTVKHTLENNPPRKYVIENTKIEVAQSNDYIFIAKLPDLSFECGELELYEDGNGGLWINHIEVKEQFHRMGIGTKLVEKAIKIHGTIYASNSHFDIGGDSDTRHLSEEGASLVNYLIQRGIMQPNWLRPPVI